MNELEKIQRDPFSRRLFLQRMGAAGLGMAAVSLLHGCGGGSDNNNSSSNFPIRAIPGRNDNEKVLNYALSLEILEADLYRQALNLASGFAPNDNNGKLRTNPGDYTLQVSSGGVANTAVGFAYLRDFAYVEAAHRDFLRTTLGAQATTGLASAYKFASTPASDLKSILAAILPLEETGVRAYLGAAPYFVNFNTETTKSYIQAAVGIYSTEARHSAALHYILGSDSGPNGTETGVPSSNKVVLNGNVLPYSDQGEGDTFEYFSTPQQVVAAIQPMLVTTAAATVKAK